MYILWFYVYSFLGWLWETALCSITERRFVNRGFLNCPYCPIYGFGALIDIFVLGWLDNAVALFVMGALLASVLEYLTSYGMEYYFHARWWDYSDRPFNLNGRICLEGALLFGAFAVLLDRVIQPRVLMLTLIINRSHLIPLALGLSVLFLLDVIYTVTRVRSLRTKLTEAALALKERVESDIASIQLELNAQEQRMARSFPRLRATLPTLTRKGKERHSLLKLWRPDRIDLRELLAKYAASRRG